MKVSLTSLVDPLDRFYFFLRSPFYFAGIFLLFCRTRIFGRIKISNYTNPIFSPPMKHSLGKETSKKRKHINEIRTCEHCDTCATLYQLRWKSNSGIEGHFCGFCVCSVCNKDKDDKMLRLSLLFKKKKKNRQTRNEKRAFQAN